MGLVDYITDSFRWVYLTALTMFSQHILLFSLVNLLYFYAPLIYFFFMAFQSVVLAMANACLMALIDWLFSHSQLARHHVGFSFLTGNDISTSETQG